MEKSIRTSLSVELFEKVQEMRDKGLNVPQLIRNFLTDYPLEQNKERIA